MASDPIAPAAETFQPALGFDHAGPLRFEGIPDAAFGIVVRGIEWKTPSAEVVKSLTLALRRHLLIVLRGQESPTEAQLDTFFRGFGRLVLDTEEGASHYAMHLSRTAPGSELAAASRKAMSRSADNKGSTYYQPGEDGIPELVWHNDQSHRPMLKILSVLEGQNVEEGAVPTEFRDTYTAYETLPLSLRSQLEHKQIIYFDPRLPKVEDQPRLADAMHPVFTAHPHTGRRALYVNDFADRIAGLNRDESDQVMSELRTHLDTMAPRYFHHWQSGDLLMWDNIGLQHRRSQVPPNQRRQLRQYGGLAE